MYNIYEIELTKPYSDSVETYEICAESEQDARILCAHSCCLSVSQLRSCKLIGKTNKPYIMMKGASK